MAFWFHIIRICTEPLSGMPATVSLPVCIVWRILHICPPLRSNEFLCRSAVPLPLIPSLFLPPRRISCSESFVSEERDIECTRVFTCAALSVNFSVHLSCGRGKHCRLRSLEPRTKQCQNAPLKVKGRSRSMRTTQRSFFPRRRLAKTSRAATEKPRRFVSSSPSLLSREFKKFPNCCCRTRNLRSTWQKMTTM